MVFGCEVGDEEELAAQEARCRVPGAKWRERKERLGEMPVSDACIGWGLDPT